MSKAARILQSKSAGRLKRTLAIKSPLETLKMTAKREEAWNLRLLSSTYFAYDWFSW